MKKAILIFAFLGATMAIQAQNAKTDATGNYVAIHGVKDTATATATGKTFSDAKGNVFPVYVTRNGKLFVNKISKAGNAYKMYLKLD